MLEGPAPVSVRFVTYDRRRDTGGEFRELKAACFGSGKRKAATEAAAAAASTAAKAPKRKRAQHYKNATRNLVDKRTGNLVKVHIYLIVEVQGRAVI